MINNNDFKKYISNFQWKMQFNLNLNKQAQKIIFSRKTKKAALLSIHFNNVSVAKGNGTCSKNIGKIVNIPIVSYFFVIRFVSLTYWKS